MIDEVWITDLDSWAAERVDELHRELVSELPPAVEVRLVGQGTPRVRVEMRLPEEWPHLRRENIHQVTEQRLSALEYNHGLAATVKRIEETGKQDRDAAFS